MPPAEATADTTSDESPHPAAPEKVSMSTGREILLIATLSTTQAVQESCLGIVIAALGPIAESFGVQGDRAQQSWFAASYALTVGTFVLPAGRLGDVYGHKKMVLVGWLWFSVWSVITGLSVYSGEVIFFNVCRGLQGVGPALLIPNAIAILGRQYPEKSLKKNIVFGLFGTLAPAGFVGGLLIGALFGQLTGDWSWAFYTIGLLCMVLGILSAFALPKSTSMRPRGNMLARVDAVGALLAVSGLVLFNFAWNQAYVVGWAAPYNGVTVGLGVILLSSFVWWEGRTAYPLVPTQYFDTESTLTLVVIVTGFMSFGEHVSSLLPVILLTSRPHDPRYMGLLLIPANSYMPPEDFLFSTNLRGYTPLAVTAQFTPILISGTIAALVTGWVLHRMGASFVLSYAMLAFVVATLLLAIAPVEQTYWGLTFVSMIIEPWGIDAAFPACTIILANRFPQEHQGAAASIVNTLVNYSISLGLGMAGTVERNVSTGDDPVEVLKGFRGAFYLGVGLAGLALAIALSFSLHDFFSARRSQSAEAEAQEEKGKS